MSGYCGARRTRDGGTCRKPSGWGTSHVGAGSCRLHGGATPNGVAAGERALADREAARLEEHLRSAAADLGAPSQIADPLTFLLTRLGEVNAWLGIVRDQVAALADADDLTQRSEFGDSVRAAVVLYERALDRAVAVAAKIAALQVDARLTAILDRDVAALERAVEAAWHSGQSGATLDTARAEAGRHLALVAGEAR